MLEKLLAAVGYGEFELTEGYGLDLQALSCLIDLKKAECMHDDVAIADKVGYGLSIQPCRSVECQLILEACAHEASYLVFRDAITEPLVPWI
jgi:hypothetical protein